MSGGADRVSRVGDAWQLTSRVSARVGRRFSVAVALGLAALTLAAGCGGDDKSPPAERTATTETTPAPSTTETAPQRTVTEPERRSTTTSPQNGSGGAKSPEDQPGGAGDEEPARSQALLTGRGGRITPRLVLVPPFIAIRVELRSADGRVYKLRVRGRTLQADGQVASVSTTFDGLKTGRRLVLRGPAGRVVVEASAEPGP